MLSYKKQPKIWEEKELWIQHKKMQLPLCLTQGATHHSRPRIWPLLPSPPHCLLPLTRFRCSSKADPLISHWKHLKLSWRLSPSDHPTAPRIQSWKPPAILQPLAQMSCLLRSLLSPHQSTVSHVSEMYCVNHEHTVQMKAISLSWLSQMVIRIACNSSVHTIVNWNWISNLRPLPSLPCKGTLYLKS